jgi:hypothetical protein
VYDIGIKAIFTGPTASAGSVPPIVRVVATAAPVTRKARRDERMSSSIEQDPDDKSSLVNVSDGAARFSAPPTEKEQADWESKQRRKTLIILFLFIYEFGSL